MPAGNTPGSAFRTVFCAHTHRTWNYASRDVLPTVLRTEYGVSEWADSFGKTHRPEHGEVCRVTSHLITGSRYIV